MFSTSGLFKNIACPNGDTCRLPNCIFSHKPPIKNGELLDVSVPLVQNATDKGGSVFTQNGHQ